MPRADLCPCCLADRVEEGQARAHQYDTGLWKGCTACGFSVSGPEHDLIRAAWDACCRSTKLKELTDG